MVFGLSFVDRDLWPTVFRCAIVILAKHSTLVILCGPCLWTSVHEDMGHLHPEAELLQALPVQMLFIYLKAYHKAGQRAGILLFVNPLPSVTI